MRLPTLFLLACIAFVPGFRLPAAAQQTATQPKPWPIRAVILTTFEVGEDTGDIPGEFQFWVEREHLDETIDFPGGVHALRTNKAHTILGVVTGTTLVNATASLMALGLDPRFDLTHAYMLINGIAGVDPHVASMGSAAWARFVVNDVSRYIDPKDAPAGWPYGFFEIGSTGPNQPKATGKTWFRSNEYVLNAGLAQWAFEQTRALPLGDDPKVAAFRAEFIGFPVAMKPPFVLLGDTFASDYYWHGATMTHFAEDWVRLNTDGKGIFAMTEMEDAGMMQAIERLDKMHKMDMQRVMVLRTGSNYTMPAPGHTAIESVTAPYIGSRLALEAAYSCGSTVLHKILADWSTTYTTIPQASAPPSATAALVPGDVNN
jgi:purine nucleoside permease